MPSEAVQRSIWSPPEPTPWQRFKRNPASFLAQYLYQRRTPFTSPKVLPSSHPISVVCISDTHNTQPAVPDGDLLLHAGDFTHGGTFEELQAQLDWLKSLPHLHKVVIAGNHDRLLDPAYVKMFPDRICEGEGTARADLDWGDITYLDNSSAQLQFSGGRRLTVYGSPWTPFCGAFAFQYPPVRTVWHDTVPQDADILLTHGPPMGHLDQGKGYSQLLDEIWRARPRLVVFGHIHAARGMEHIEYDDILRAYDRVMGWDRGLLAVFLMACRWMGERLWSALLRRKEKRGTLRGTTLVNAAVVAGQGNRIEQPATVVSI